MKRALNAAVLFSLVLAPCVALAEHDAGVADARIDRVDAALPSLPEGHRPTVLVQVANSAPLGDLLPYQLRVQLPEGDDVTVPQQSFGDFEVHARRHREHPLEGGRRELIFEFDLLCFSTGEHSIPGLELRVVTRDGVIGQARGEPRVVNVQSRLGNTPNAEVRPPSEPVIVMQDDYTLAWIGGALGLVLLGALVTWLLMRWWRKRPKAIPPPPPPRPPWEKALVRLRELRLRMPELLERGARDEFVDGVNDTLREYFGVRYGFNGLESTTDEILQRLKQVNMQSISLHEVSALLSQCDLIKFAKAMPSNEMCEEILDVSGKIVRGTIPAAVQMDGPGAYGGGNFGGRS